MRDFFRHLADGKDEVPHVLQNRLLLLRTTAHSGEGEPRNVGVCHCLACQRRTGSVFAALASFAAPFEVFGTATEYVRVGDQGASFIFRSCPVCGTTVFHTEVGYDDSLGVAVGAFADPSFPAPSVSVYDSRRHPWVRLPPGTVTFEKDPV